MTAADELATAADLVDKVAEGADDPQYGPWSQPHVRAALAPWVALMGPAVAPHLSALLREAARDVAAIDGQNEQAAEQDRRTGLAGATYAAHPDWTGHALRLARALTDRTKEVTDDHDND